MIEELGTVVEADAERIQVEVARASACGTCSAQSGCGVGSLAKVFGVRPVRLWLRNELGATVGDRVVLGIEEGALVGGSLLIYLLPLVALLLASAGGQALALAVGLDNTEPLVLVSGLAGLGVSLWWVRGFTRRAGAQERFQPVVLRRL